MDLYAVVKVVHKINDHTFDFSIPWASPYSEVYQALEDIKAQVVKMEENAKTLAAQQAAAAQENAGVSVETVS